MITRGITRDFRITGILKDLPKNTHFKTTGIARLDYAGYNFDTPDVLTCWGCQNGHVYVKLRSGADPQAIEEGLPAWDKRTITDQHEGEANFNVGEHKTRDHDHVPTRNH